MIVDTATPFDSSKDLHENKKKLKRIRKGQISLEAVTWRLIRRINDANRDRIRLFRNFELK